MTPALVTVRFRSARAGLCGVHYSGIDYDVPAAFAKQVVEEEHVADYVTVPASQESGTRTKPKKR